MTEPTIEELIAWLEDIAWKSNLGRRNSEATLTILRDHVRLKAMLAETNTKLDMVQAEADRMLAMLDDPNIVRVPRGLRLNLGIDVKQAEAQVAAWDKERK